jgi:hypothetical protein
MQSVRLVIGSVANKDLSKAYVTWIERIFYRAAVPDHSRSGLIEL